MGEDREKQSLRRQIEILTIQKDTSSKQLAMLRKEIALESADSQKNRIKLLDEIRAKDIEIKAVKRFLKKRETTLREELRNEFSTVQMEKEQVAEVSKELAAKRNLLDTLIQVRKSEFEEKLNTEKALFEKAKNEFRKEIITLNSETSKNRQKLLLSAEEHSKEKEVLENQVLRLKQEIQELQSKMKTLSDEKNNLAGDMENRTAELDKLREGMNTLKDQSQNEKKILGNSVKKLLKAEKEIEKSTGLKIKTQELSKQIEILTSEKKSLKNESKKITAQTYALQKLIAQKDKESGIQIEKLAADMRKKENSGFTNRIKKLESTINSLESDRNKLQEKVAQLQLNLQAQPEKRKLVKKKFKCSECGGINYESDTMCSHCGAKFE